MVIATERSDVQMFDFATRLALTLMSASEPFAVLLVVGSEPVAPWKLLVILAATAVHTWTCVLMLRAGIAHFLGGPRPPRRLVTLTGTTTLLALAAALVVLAGQSPTAVFSVAALVLGFVTYAFAPAVRLRVLVAAIAIPTVGVAAVHLWVPDVYSTLAWGWSYLLLVGSGVFLYRWSVWMLGVAWKIHHSKAVQARLAVAEERLRFARDLHDTLGRNLALITINTELAAKFVRLGQEGAQKRLSEVQQVAQDSMREMREVVGGYRATNLSAELSGARSLLRSAGSSVWVIGDGGDLPAEIQTALGWVVREATTNVIRHSVASAVRIEFQVLGGAAGDIVTLRIENDGVGATTPEVISGGKGLLGLRERIEAMRGNLQCQPLAPDRFLVVASLPLTAQRPTHAPVSVLT